MNSFAQYSVCRRFVALAMLVCCVHSSFAACTSDRAVITMAAKSYSGSSDRIRPGLPLDSMWSNRAGAKELFSLSDCNAASIFATPGATAIPGLSYSDGKNTYPVYPTGVAGIGYVASVAEQDYNEWFVLDGRTRLYSGKAWSWMGAYAKIMFVVTGRLKSNIYTIPAQTIVRANVYASKDGDGTPLTSAATISLGSTSITIDASTCRMTTSPNQTVALPAVAQSALAVSGATAGDGVSFHIGMSCDAAVALYLTMTDATTPASTTNTLSLASGSTAKGVGVQVFYNGSSTPVSYGPDSPVKGNINQWKIGSSDAAMSYEIPFTAAYVRTGKVTPGSVQAKATFTFSYQ